VQARQAVEVLAALRAQASEAAANGDLHATSALGLLDVFDALFAAHPVEYAPGHPPRAFCRSDFCWWPCPTVIAVVRAVLARWHLTPHPTGAARRAAPLRGAPGVVPSAEPPGSNISPRPPRGAQRAPVAHATART